MHSSYALNTVAAFHGDVEWLLDVGSGATTGL